MITVGIDPSLTGTGVVVLKDGKLEKKELIKTKPDASKIPINELKRILSIVEKIEKTVNQYDVRIVAIEGLSFGARNTTALIQLSGLNYLIRKLLYESKIPFVIVAPTTLKKYATGKGNGSKDVIIMNVYKKYGVTIAENNQADAFILSHIADSLVRNVKLTKAQSEVINLLQQQL